MPLPRLPLALPLALLLAACGGGEDGPAASQTVTVTPALGQAWAAEVRVSAPDGRLLGAGAVGSDGHIVLPRGNGGLLVEVRGNDDAFYFDEGAGAARRLSGTRRLYAVSPGPRADIAVSALTELVYRRAAALAGSSHPGTAAVAQAESEVAALFGAPSGGSFLAAPQLLNDLRDLPDTATAAGQAARLHAGFAVFAFDRAVAAQPACATDPECAPLVDFLEVLAADFSDGILDSAADGTPLASPFYDAASAAALPAAIEAAADSYLARVNAARAVVTADDRIGARYAGRYALDCHHGSSGAGVAMSLVIGDDGGFVINGPFGRLALGVGDSTAVLDEVSGNRGYLRNGVVIPDLAVATASPVGDGLSIGIGGGSTGAIEIVAPSPVFAAAGAYAFNGGFVLYQSQVWNCDGFPAPDTPALDGTVLSGWLADGIYYCESADPAVMVPALVEGGSLRLGDGTPWDYTAAQRRRETAPDALTVAPDSSDHLHARDAIAGARMPLLTLDLAASDAEEAPGNRLQLRRSLVSGTVYFNAEVDGVSVRHCLDHGAVNTLAEGVYRRNSGVNVVSGYLTGPTVTGGTITATFGNVTVSPLPPFTAGSCWGSTAFC